VPGFTAANGEPLLCAIIFAAKSMKREWETGFDPFAEWIGSEDNIEEKLWQQQTLSSTCTFNGKEIPCFCCNCESGSITGPLLTSMLSYIDTKEVFDHSTGLNPFCEHNAHKRS
jgi:hypothetical protein